MTPPQEALAPLTPEPAPGPQINTLVDLYSKHERRIYRYCLALLKNPNDAEDATQETFTRAAPFLHRLPGDLSAYLTTVARNICCDVVRSRSRRSVPIDALPIADRTVSPERQSVDWDVVHRMWRHLNPAERILLAYTFAGYRYEEIAARTGMSRPAVSVGIARARRRLRDLAAATGTLGVLPLGIRRLLDRVARRVQPVVASSQATLAGVVDQVGAIVAAVIAGLVVSGPGVQPALALAGDHLAPASAGGGSATVPLAAAVSRAGETAGGGEHERSKKSTGDAPRVTQGPTALPPTLNGWAADLPGYNATPETTNLDSMTVSPSYGTDRTVFIVGTHPGDACDNCHVLFRTRDGGASWERLGLLGYDGGDVLLSPAYLADPTIYIINDDVGLEKTTDGSVFTPLVPGASAAAVAPDSRAQGARLAVVVSHTEISVYDAATQRLTAGPVLPAGFFGTTIAYTGADRVLVGGHLPTLQSVVVSCSLDGACGTPVPLTSGFINPTLVASPGVLSDGIVAVWLPDGVYVSTDRGTTFTRTNLPSTIGDVTSLSIAHTAAGMRIAVGAFQPVQPIQPTTAAGVVMLSDDLGRSWSTATGNLATWPEDVFVNVVSGGAMVSGVSAQPSGRFAMLCSSGDGVWTSAC